jgi:hypothetical protein
MQHLGRVVVPDHVDGELGGVVEWSLERMAWLRAGLRVAFEVDPSGLDQASRLVSLEVDNPRHCESARFRGLDVEENEITTRI